MLRAEPNLNTSVLYGHIKIKATVDQLRKIVIMLRNTKAGYQKIDIYKSRTKNWSCLQFSKLVKVSDTAHYSELVKRIMSDLERNLGELFGSGNVIVEYSTEPPYEFLN